MYGLSGSNLEIADVCAPSAVLPHARELPGKPAAIGTAKHLYTSLVDEAGMEAALLRVPEEFRALCRRMDLSSLPIGPKYDTEVTFAYDPWTRKARRLGRQLDRDYRAKLPTEIPLTLDVVTTEEESRRIGYVAIRDYKGPHAEVPPAPRNWQLRIGALAACTLYAIPKSEVGIIRFLENDTADHRPTAWLDDMELDLVHSQFMDLVQRVQRAAEVLRGGGVPDVVRGAHCEDCAAVVSCPANATLIMLMATQPGQVQRSIEEAVRTAPALAVAQLAIAKKLIEEVGKAVRAHAAQQPITMPDGKIFGPYSIKDDTLYPNRVRQVMEDLHGDEVADIAAPYPDPEPETTKAAISKALAHVAKETGATKAELEREFYDRLRKARGIDEGRQPRLGLHWPPKER